MFFRTGSTGSTSSFFVGGLLVFFVKRFPVSFNLFVLLLLVTPCLVVAVQPCIEWIPIKGTLMQIWKSQCLLEFIWKYCTENFAFLILRIMELFTCKVCFLLKNRVLFKVFYCFCMLVNKHFANFTGK